MQLYARLVATVDSKDFLARIKSFHQATLDGNGNMFPFREATGCQPNLIVIEYIAFFIF